MSSKSDKGVENVSENNQHKNADSSEEILSGLAHLSLQGKKSEEDTVDASPSMRAVASWIEASRNILVLTGAGVSVSAGIPDFRTPGTGLYDNLQKYNLPFPEAVFELNFYRRNPEPFCSLAQEMWPGLKHAPTLTHCFVALLAKKQCLLRNYSQNIDGLEFLANTPADKLVECHGHYRSGSCIECRKEADMDAVRKAVVESGEPLRCTNCSGLVKPDIVFFGEDLPERFHQLLVKDKHVADLVLVLGTSLQVAPVSMIPEMVSRKCKRVLINRELVGSFEGSCHKNVKADIDGRRDLFLSGNCDDTILVLAKLLGWHDELQTLHTKVQDAIKADE